MISPLRVLYLGISFPPGQADRYPGVNPAGHTFESGMLEELSGLCDLRTVTTLPVELGPEPASTSAASSVGWPHRLALLDAPPHALNRWRSVRKLRRWLVRQIHEGWAPDVVLSYNTMPIYNAFLRGLRGSDRPSRVLLMLDSPQLGRRLSFAKRLRMKLKPFTDSEEAMLPLFDGCIGLSRDVERYFSPRKTPFLWMPGGCSRTRAALVPEGGVADHDPTRPLRFGYFGSLGPHAGPVELAKLFASMDSPHELVLCGYGKQAAELEELSRRHRGIRFDGWLETAADTVRFGSSCDVLVNPRPPGHGNENNFPSKLFDYALCGRAVISTRLSGADAVLGPEAFYVDAAAYSESLLGMLRSAGACSAAELLRKGRAIRSHVMAGYSWSIQAARIVEFLDRVARK